MDTELLRFEVPDGGRVLMEMDDQEPGVLRGQLGRRHGPLSEQSLESAQDNVRAASNVALGKLQDAQRLMRSSSRAPKREAGAVMFTYANHPELYAEEIGITGEHRATYPKPSPTCR